VEGLFFVRFLSVLPEFQAVKMGVFFFFPSLGFLFSMTAALVPC